LAQVKDSNPAYWLEVRRDIPIVSREVDTSELHIDEMLNLPAA